VEIIIEISLDRYDGFIDKCDQSSRDYETLKNGVIVRRPKEDHFERIVEIKCSVQEAKGLLDLAKQIYPDAAADIEKALAVPRNT
jgi:hypothetical protein